jgi:hypothetical protein
MCGYCMSLFSTASSEKDRERHRFYLLPGMGGRALRRKHRRILRWSLLAGVLVSALLAGLLYLLNTMMRHP